MNALHRLTKELLEAMSRSQQCSYGRRAPTKASSTDFQRIRREIKLFLDVEPECERAWRLLRQVEEALLRYAAALEAHSRAMRLSGKRSRKDLKTLARLKQNVQDWSDLDLSPSELHELGEFLERQQERVANNRGTELTEEWLIGRFGETGLLRLDSLRRRGGFSDLLILNNLVRG